MLLERGPRCSTVKGGAEAVLASYLLTPDGPAVSARTTDCCVPKLTALKPAWWLLMRSWLAQSIYLCHQDCSVARTSMAVHSCSWPPPVAELIGRVASAVLAPAQTAVQRPVLPGSHPRAVSPVCAPACRCATCRNRSCLSLLVQGRAPAESASACTATDPLEGPLLTLQQLILACTCTCRQALLQFLLVPLLQLAPLSYQMRILQQRAAALISIIKGESEGMSPSVAAEEGSALMAQAAAYRLLHVMYDSVPKEAIKDILKDVGGNKVAG